MKRFDANIRALDGTLQEIPEVLQSVRVYRAINILFGVVNNIVSVFVQAVVGLQCVGVQLRTYFYVLANLAVKVVLAARSYHRRAHLASLAIKPGQIR